LLLANGRGTALLSSGTRSSNSFTLPIIDGSRCL
jgi:hypothetical protein